MGAQIDKNIMIKIIRVDVIANFDLNNLYKKSFDLYDDISKFNMSIILSQSKFITIKTLIQHLYKLEFIGAIILLLKLFI